MSRALDVAACQDLVASARWLDKIQQADNGCLLWVGFVHKGYGRVSVNGRAVTASRVALVAALGRDIASEKDVGHLCHDLAFAAGECEGGICIHRRCVNPLHLEEQSRRDNLLAGVSANAKKTHCPRGHELVAGNLSLRALPKRSCLKCAQERDQKRVEVIAAAHKMLGITQREYVRKYGRSLATAESILGRVSE